MTDLHSYSPVGTPLCVACGMGETNNAPVTLTAYKRLQVERAGSEGARR